jgi:hypothetical protein
MNAREILMIPMQDNGAHARTIGEYLKKLLLGVWEEGDGFDGKRPFGNSGWEGELYTALIQGGAITGEFDEDRYLDAYDEDAANRAIRDAIEYAFTFNQTINNER